MLSPKSATRNVRCEAKDNPLKRSSKACDRCRRRKHKCTGVSPHPCLACEEAGQTCVYSNHKKVLVSESYLSRLRRMAANTSKNTGAQPRENTRPPSTEPDEATSYQDDDVGTDIDQNLWVDEENLFLNQYGERYYVGTSSSAYLAQKLRACERGPGWDFHPMYKDPSSLRRSANQELPPLPPIEFARRLFRATHKFLGKIFCFCRQEEFMARLERVYERAREQSMEDDCLEVSQVLVVLAFGQLYSVNQWSSNEGPPGFTYFTYALKFLPDIHNQPSILFVEVLLLIAPFLQNLNRRDAGFLYIGSALRMAISLGLHRELTGQNIETAEQDHRRRVWWSVYSMDRIMSVKSGNPVSIHDDDIDVQWPSLTWGYGDNNPEILIHYTKLSRVLGQIGQGIFRNTHRSGAELLKCVQTILYELQDLHRNIPSVLRIDFDTLDTTLTRDKVSTFLHYAQCVIMTARPILYYVFKKQIEALNEGISTHSWQDGLSASIVSVIDSAISAACASAFVSNTAIKQDTYATYGFMDVEHSFSAALILVMVNKAFPSNDRNILAMNTAISVLQTMVEKGNKALKAQLSLLLDLRATIGQHGTSPHSPDIHGSSGSDPGASNLAVEHNSEQVMPNTSAEVMSTSVQNSGLHQFSQYDEATFDLNFDDDPGLWDELSGTMVYNLDNEWIENALLKDARY